MNALVKTTGTLGGDRIAPTFFERVLGFFSPASAIRRMSSRLALGRMKRGYDGASIGRRTSGWGRAGTDANAETRGATGPLRNVARDLVRNNSWAKRSVQVIGNNTIGRGIRPRTTSVEANELWNSWAGTTACDFDGVNTFYGLQRMITDSIVMAGESLVVRRFTGEGFPLQLQVLEPDFIDTTKDTLSFGSVAGQNRIIQGIEFDDTNRIVAYWIYDQHPGDQFIPSSTRVLSENILHIYKKDRPGQVRGVSWFAPVIVKIHDFDDYEDALLMRQKIAACFAVFITNVDGGDDPLGTDDSTEDIEALEPGMVKKLGVGEDISFASPPAIPDNQTFSQTTLRAIAAGFGITYEDMSGDYSQSNFSSSRMGRIAHWANVREWQHHMLIPQLCDPVWVWFQNTAIIAGLLTESVSPTWTTQPMPMIDPEKEGLALRRNIRSGLVTHNQMILESGRDPNTHWADYKEGLNKLDELEIILDSDARKVSDAGLAQNPGDGATNNSDDS